MVGLAAFAAASARAPLTSMSVAPPSCTSSR